MQQPINLLTPEQVSSLLGIKTHTLAVWRSSGRYKLPFIKTGRLVRYQLSDIENFLETQRMISTNVVAS